MQEFDAPLSRSAVSAHKFGVYTIALCGSAHKFGVDIIALRWNLPNGILCDM
jgi:hypothetical protein